MSSKFLKAVLVILIALIASRIQSVFKKAPSTIKSASTAVTATATATNTATNTMPSISSLFNSTFPKTPVYFFSHGGPTFMYEEAEFGGDVSAFRATSKLGKFIKEKIKPNFIIVVSAHWESNHLNTVEVAIPNTKTFNSAKKITPLENELIYDFYGFPEHMYKEKFHSQVNLELANDIKDTLLKAGVDSNLTYRGIDHGVWVPFKVAFSTNKLADDVWDLDIPIVQVSLARTDEFGIHSKVGEILSKYRSLGGLVICSGMSVHNLRDMGRAMRSNGPLPYVKKFNSVLTEILTKNAESSKRLELLNEVKLSNANLLYSAHPTLEHFNPVVVASGAANHEVAKEIYNNAVGSLGWGIYQFGEWK